MISYKSEADFVATLKDSRKRYEEFKERALPTFVTNMLRVNGILLGYVNVICSPYPELFLSLIINAVLNGDKLDFVILSVDVLEMDEWLDLYSQLRDTKNLKVYTK